MAEFVFWPRSLLAPKACRPNLVPFTRSGGRSLGGVRPATRTDLGFWSVEYAEVLLHTVDQQRTFEAMKGQLSGSAGRVCVPIHAPKRVPYSSGAIEGVSELPHSDDTLFEDGTGYVQNAVTAVTVGLTPMGATTMRLRVISGSQSIAGTLFSIGHALYSISQVLDQDGDIQTVRICPTVRELIPSGADLEFDEPTCLCNLASDSAMADGETFEGYQPVSVSFVEDTDYWNKLALGLV